MCPKTDIDVVYTPASIFPHCPTGVINGADANPWNFQLRPVRKKLGVGGDAQRIGVPSSRSQATSVLPATLRARTIRCDFHPDYPSGLGTDQDRTKNNKQHCYPGFHLNLLGLKYYFRCVY